MQEPLFSVTSPTPTPRADTCGQGPFLSPPCLEGVLSSAGTSLQVYTLPQLPVTPGPPWRPHLQPPSWETPACPPLHQRPSGRLSARLCCIFPTQPPWVFLPRACDSHLLRRPLPSLPSLTSLPSAHPSQPPTPPPGQAGQPGKGETSLPAGQISKDHGWIGSGLCCFRK